MKEDAMDGASEGDHIAVLERWKASGLELKWTDAVDWGSEDARKWWESSGLNLMAG